MKKLLTLFCGLALLIPAASAQQKAYEPNYELAEQFTAKKVSNMVFSLSVTPNWFSNSDRFWYQWKTAEGTQYYIVDPTTGSKKAVFDMEKLAMQLSEIVKDPFDAKHIPLQKFKLSEDDKCFTFEIKSTEMVEKKEKKGDDGSDADGEEENKKEQKKGKKENKIFRFEYDIASGTLKDVTDDPEKKTFPMWANVSPDGTKAIYTKNSNLWWMSMEDVRKLQEDKKDSTVVEHQITTDATKDSYYGGGSYRGTTVKDTTARMGAGIIWSPDSRHFAVIKYDTDMIKDLWVINSVAQPRPTLETYHYQMPGEPGAVEHLFIGDIEDGSLKEIGVAAFKDQTLDIQTKPALKKDANKEYR
ncbi:MAG: DPP IV N-terminal domain-containing protein, partial [Bacteroidales bacterium]|nr:DPP IV N-terminal domain-containing protein [Bacteroidales bacterium]